MGCAPAWDDPLEAGLVRFDRRSADGIDDCVDLEAVAQGVERRER
jgi:hypothetical protein